MSTTPHRGALRTLSVTWPVGLLIVAVTMELPGVGLPLFIGLDLIFVAAVVTLVLRLGGREDALATALVAIGVGIFALVGFSGPPTADDPTLMLVNTAALLLVAVAILVVAAQLAVRHRHSAAAVRVVPALVLLAVGSGLYVANLLARVAVVLSGTSDRQAALEDAAWVAYEYLRGLPSDADLMGFVLVWLDLIQLGYVATVYIAFAGLARLLRTEHVVTTTVGRRIEVAGHVLAGILVVGVVLAVTLPRDLDLLPAWAAFVTSIPFMTTLLPFALGVAMLAARTSARHVTDAVVTR